MTDQIQNLTQEQIKEFLPATLRKALSSYREFVEKEDFATNDGFSKDHTACKVAISHIELLIKLGRLAYAGEGEAEDPENKIAAMQDYETFLNNTSDNHNELA